MTVNFYNFFHSPLLAVPVISGKFCKINVILVNLILTLFSSDVLCKTDLDGTEDLGDQRDVIFETPSFDFFMKFLSANFLKLLKFATGCAIM